MKKYIILLLAIITITSCTENSRAKGWGGTAEVILPKGKKLVMQGVSLMSNNQPD